MSWCWGYLQLTGRIEEPFSAGLKRIVMLAVVLGVALQLWLYNSVIVDTFYNAPAQLAAAVVGAADPVSTIDAIWDQGGAVAASCGTKGPCTGGRHSASTSRAPVVWLLIGLLCVYAMFLIALSSIASAVLLAIGPLFVALLLFDSTRRFFDAWLAQLANYALITILTVLVGGTVAAGGGLLCRPDGRPRAGLLTVDALDMLLIAMLVFLMLRQIMPIASSLAGGLTLNSFGSISRFGAELRRHGRGGKAAGWAVVARPPRG